MAGDPRTLLCWDHKSDTLRHILRNHEGRGKQVPISGAKPESPVKRGVLECLAKADRRFHLGSAPPIQGTSSN